MKHQKIIGWWLLLGVALLMFQVLLGGITRLTGSGLSITEWKPLLGALPPMNEIEWLDLFEKYKQIAQFKYLNQDFSLADFKFIFFWEWMHRNWARLISLVFLLPFFYFLWKRMITRDMVPKLIGLFALGLAQGLIGWIMVASGINDTNLYVSHIRLAIHFISALVLIAFTFWFALSLLIVPEQKFSHKPFQSLTLGMMVLLFIQLTYGAFMAGLKAASVAASWPLINGALFPATLNQGSIIHHPIWVHFIHRGLAFLLTLLMLAWFIMASKINASTYFKRFKFMPVLFLILQVILGIGTVLNAAKPTRNGFGYFESMALLHQAVAMCLLMSLVWVLFISSRTNAGKPI